jgi:hypothetical protein
MLYFKMDHKARLTLNCYYKLAGRIKCVFLRKVETLDQEKIKQLPSYPKAYICNTHTPINGSSERTDS